MARNLVRLWRLTGDDAYRNEADAIIAAASIAENLFAATGMLSALDLRLGATDLVIVAPAGADPGPMLAAARAAWTPNLILTLVDDPASLPPGHPASGKPAVGVAATAYVCRGETCSLPVTDPASLASLIANPEAR
jgi:uncharacterized protein YyaL (SSP411 family)